MTGRRSAENDRTPENVCAERHGETYPYPCAECRGYAAGFAAGRADVARGVRAWCAINEIAEPPLNWEGLGEFLTRVTPPAATDGDVRSECAYCRWPMSGHGCDCLGGVR